MDDAAAIAAMMRDLGVETRDLVSAPPERGANVNASAAEEERIQRREEKRRANAHKLAKGDDKRATVLQNWNSEENFDHDDLAGQMVNRYSGQGHRDALERVLRSGGTRPQDAPQKFRAMGSGSRTFDSPHKHGATAKGGPSYRSTGPAGKTRPRAASPRAGGTTRYINGQKITNEGSVASPVARRATRQDAPPPPLISSSPPAIPEARGSLRAGVVGNKENEPTSRYQAPPIPRAAAPMLFKLEDNKAPPPSGPRLRSATRERKVKTPTVPSRAPTPNPTTTVRTIHTGTIDVAPSVSSAASSVQSPGAVTDTEARSAFASVLARMRGQRGGPVVAEATPRAVTPTNQEQSVPRAASGASSTLASSSLALLLASEPTVVVPSVASSVPALEPASKPAMSRTIASSVTSSSPALEPAAKLAMPRTVASSVASSLKPEPASEPTVPRTVVTGLTSSSFAASSVTSSPQWDDLADCKKRMQITVEAEDEHNLNPGAGNPLLQQIRRQIAREVVHHASNPNSEKAKQYFTKYRHWMLAPALAARSGEYTGQDSHPMRMEIFHATVYLMANEKAALSQDKVVPMAKEATPPTPPVSSPSSIDVVSAPLSRTSRKHSAGSGAVQPPPKKARGMMNANFYDAKGVFVQSCDWEIEMPVDVNVKVESKSGDYSPIELAAAMEKLVRELRG